MFQKLAERIAFAFILAVIMAATNCAFAWQMPDEAQSAPRLTDDASPRPAEINNPLVKDTSEAERNHVVPGLGRSVMVPAPAIVPVEEIIAGPTKVAPAPQPDFLTDGVAPRIDSTAPRIADSRGSAPPMPIRPVAATHKPMLFKQAEPGVTTTQRLKELWGDPENVKRSRDTIVQIHALPPFSHVEAKMVQDVLSSITIKLASPIDIDAAISRLGLASLRPTHTFDATGHQLTRTFPERGVTLDLKSENDGYVVSQISLNPLSAGAFLQRVQNDDQHRWLESLADLDAAAKLSPKDERTHWLRAEVLWQQSEYRAAALAIEKALVVRPELSLYQLTAARLIAEAGSYDDAIAAASATLKGDQVPPLLKARAALQLGDFLAESPQHDYAGALKYHQQSIQLALPLATHERRDLRLAAKRVLIDAHAAVADDIAQGNWQQKDEAVTQWMNHSHALAKDVVENENGSPSVEFDVLCKRLDAMAWLEGKVDVTNEIAAMAQIAGQLKQSSTDATYQRHIDWQYAKAMIDAVDIERARGNPVKALEYGAIAEQTMSPLAGGRWKTEATQFQLSRLYFLLGSIQATELEDHGLATKWFDKGMDGISRPAPDDDPALSARRGNWMVSMGVSYWRVGRKTEALRLTQLGAALIKSARDAGAASDESLAAPYNNLAAMHQELGNEDDAKRFAELAGEVEASLQR